MKRSRFWSGICAAGLGLSAPACAGREISVGSDRGEGLDRCVGASDDCRGGVATEPSGATELGACPDEAGAQLEVDYEFRLSERLCPPSPGACADAGGNVPVCPLDPETMCSARLLAAKPAPDGSLWLVTTTQRGLNGQHVLWLGHLGSDGSDQGFLELAMGTALRGNGVYYAADLAVDADSHAHIIINGNDPGPDADSVIRDHTWLEQYDQEGNPVGGAWDLPGLARSFVALTPGGRVAVAGNAMDLERRAIAALFERNSTLLWSQPKIPSTGARSLGILGLGVDREENVFVYTHRQERRTTSELGVMMFDASGARVWDRTIAGGFAGSIAYEGCFGADDDGNVTVAGYPPSTTGAFGAFDGPVRFLSLDKLGTARWTLDVDKVLPGVRVAAETGDVYASGAGGVVRISSAGECERIAWPEDERGLGSIEPARDGALYFVSPWSVGRYKALSSD